MEGVLAEIRMWAANFAPKCWMLCQGQTLSIAQNSALFSLLGTTYGGDGVSTFKLPDLRGRVPVGAGTGAGLTARELGESFGSETVTETAVSVGRPLGPAAGVKADASDTVSVVQPSLGVNYIICVEGIYPSRG